MACCSLQNKMRKNHVLVLVLLSYCNVCKEAMAMAGVSEGFSHRDSTTTLYSSYNYLKCTSSEHVTPRSTADIAALIKRWQTSPVKIRATRRGFHSSAGFVCSGSRGSSKAEYSTASSPSSTPSSITVLMHLMNRVVDVDRGRKRLTVEAGMTLLELVKAAEANGFSVPPGALSVYGNLTVGGVILASAHGSGLGAVSSLQDLVTAMKWVDGHGEVIVSDGESEEVRALVGGLGLLGIVTEVTLQLHANSRTVVEVRKGLSDANIVDDLMESLRTETPHIITFWRPDFGRYKMVMFTEESESKKGVEVPEFYPNGKFTYLPVVDEEVGKAWGEALEKWEDDEAEESPSADAMNAEICNIANILHNISVFEDGEGNALEHATIPTNSAMEAEDCSPHCFFSVHHMRAFIEDTEFTIKLSQLQDWVNDVKSIVARELSEIRTQTSTSTRCVPPGYFWLRFGQGNPNLLSTAGGREDVVYVQWTHLHTAKLANKLSKQSTIAETLEQVTLCKYRGRPHWGKNHERVFRHPECKVRDNFDQENLDSFLKLQQVHDPLRMFEPELFTHLLARSGPEYRELCTPHFWCYCERDEHCPRGHACRPSSSFPEFKICKLLVVRDINRQTSHVEL